MMFRRNSSELKKAVPTVPMAVNRPHTVPYLGGQSSISSVFSIAYHAICTTIAPAVIRERPSLRFILIFRHLYRRWTRLLDDLLDDHFDFVMIPILALGIELGRYFYAKAEIAKAADVVALSAAAEINQRVFEASGNLTPTSQT